MCVYKHLAIDLAKTMAARLPAVVYMLSAVVFACLLRSHAGADVQQSSPAWPLAAPIIRPTRSSNQAVLPAAAPAAADAPTAGAASPLPAVQPTTASRGGAAAAPSAPAQAPEQAVPAALRRRSLSEDTVFTQGMLPLDNRGQAVRALRTLPSNCSLSKT